MSYVYGNVVGTFVDSLALMAVCMISALHHGLDPAQAKSVPGKQILLDCLNIL